MRRLTIAVVLATFTVVGTASATTTHVHRPPGHITVKRQFQPTSHPSVSYVPKILRSERRKWGGPSLAHRAWCESGYRWYAGNGTYNGILALGQPAWNILWPGTPRRVHLEKHRSRWVRVNRVTIWNSGRRTKKHIGSIHQKVRVTYSGRLPRHPSVFHAWAAIRSVQIYVAKYGGGGPISWSCSL